MARLGFDRVVISRDRPYDPNPVTANEYMDALNWQIQHPYHLLSTESVETIAKALRRLKKPLIS